MGEIATHSMIKDKTSFGSTGTECPVKTTIKSISSYIVIDNESTYGNPECVKIEDISALQYTFSVNPWQLEVSGDGGTSNAYGVTSTKTANGTTTNVSWTIDTTSIPSWLTHNAASKTFTAGINTTGAQRQVNIYFDQAESGLRDHCVVTQPKRTDVYVFTANPTTLTLNAINGSGTIDVTSTLNGMSTPWTITTQPASWVTLTESIDGYIVKATDNTSPSKRTTTMVLTQTGSTKPPITITIEQLGAETKWEYFFSVNATYHTFPNSGGSYSFTITSYKQYYVNGQESGSPVTLPYTSQRSSGSSAFTMSGSTVSVSANTTHSKREATFSLTQTEDGSSTGKSLILSVDQDPADDEYEFKITWTSGSDYAETLYVTYPWQVTVADYKTFYIRSRKNGAVFNNISGFTSDASWINITSTTAFTYSLEDNDTGEDRTGTLTLTQAVSGYQCHIVVTQTKEPAIEGWKYYFTVTPTTMSFVSGGNTNATSVTSYRVKTINGVEQSGTREAVDWYSEPKESWLSGVDAPGTGSGIGVGSGAITAAENTNTSPRSGIVTYYQTPTSPASYVNKVDVTCNQAAKVEDVYVFTWNDGSTTDLPTGPFKANEPGFTIGPPRVPIISTKNGTTHGYSVTSKPSWITADISDVNGAIKIDIDKNTSSLSRNGNIVLTQNDSGKTLTITISQTGYAYEFQWVNGGVVEGTDVISYTLTVAPGYVFNSSSEINGLVSTRSVDDWATNAEPVDFTVIDNDENSWLTVTSNVYGGSDNPGLYSIFFSGTVPDSETTYTVQFLQHESAKACLFKIVVESKVQNLIQISSANYDGKYNVYFQAADPVASDVQITYTLIKTGANNNTNAVTMRTGQRIAGIIGLEVTRNDYEAVRIEFVSPQSDSTYAYTYSAATVPINYPVDVSASCRFYGSFGTMVSSDHPMIIPLTSVVNFDGSTSNVASYLKIPTEYNAENTALQLDGKVSFNVEANNNTTNSMKSIEVELLYSTTESDVGTDYGALISSWIENYPVGGKYITIEVQNETVNSSLLDVTDHNTPIYLWFNVRVVYEGWDNPMISCTTSSISFTLTSR